LDSLNLFLNVLFLIVGTVLGLFLKSFLPDYFGQKGKNLATKEDIEEITEKTERARRRQQRREEKVNKVNEQLKRFAELAELYAFFARKEVRSESDKIRRGEDEIEFIARDERVLEPEPRFEQAIEALTGSDFKGAIAQKIVEIHLNSGEATDIARELDSSGELYKKFQKLYWQTVKSIEFWIKHKDYEQMVSSLQEARRTRGEIYSMLQYYRNDDQ